MNDEIKKSPSFFTSRDTVGKRGTGRASVPEIDKGGTVFKANTSCSCYKVGVDGKPNA